MTIIKKKTKPCRSCQRTDTVKRSGFCHPVCEAPELTKPKTPTLPDGTDAQDAGQWPLFLRLLDERGPFSEVSNTKLITDTKHPLFVSQFSHTLPKGTYPDYKLDPRNIVLLTAEEHRQWGEAKETLRNRPEWQRVFDIESMLLGEIYRKNKGRVL